MPFQLVFTGDYTRRALRFLKRHPELKAQYGKTLALLEMNHTIPRCVCMRCRAGCRGCTRCRSTCRTASPWNC